MRRLLRQSPGPAGRGRDGCFAAARLLLLVALALPAMADWRDSFVQGVRARDLARWQEAADWLRKAIREKPAEDGEKVRVYGMRWEPYLPYYNLGMVLYELGDCRSAVLAFDRSAGFGAAGWIERQKAATRQDECRTRLSGPRTVGSPPSWPPPSAPSTTPSTAPSTGPSSSPPPQPPPQPQPQPSQPPRPPQTTEEVRRESLQQGIAEARASLRRAEDVVRTLDAHLERTRRAAFRRAPDLEKAYQAAYRRLNSARNLLNAGQQENDLQAVNRAATEARAAQSELEAVARKVGVPGR